MAGNRSSLNLLPVGMTAVAIAFGVFTLVVTGAGKADAWECRKNYYKCDLNRGGRIDPANPGCCWSPAAGPPSISCPPKFYRCDLNKNGRIDPVHPGCCWNLK
jgi:hypothetical protein